MNEDLKLIVKKRNPTRVYVKQKPIVFSKETLMKEIDNAKR